MSIPNTRQLKRRPTHPGEMLGEDFMPDYGLTVAGLAEALGVSRQSINELLPNCYLRFQLNLFELPNPGSQTAVLLNLRRKLAPTPSWSVKR
jgi:hypothetical protein